MRSKRMQLRGAAVAAVLLVAGLLAMPPSSAGHKDLGRTTSADGGRGYSYGTSSADTDPPNQPLPEAEVELPNPPEQEQVRSRSDQDQALTSGVVTARVEADVCLDPGVSAKLQKAIDREQIKSHGLVPAADTDNVNDPNNELDEDPQQGEMRYPERGFPATARCVTQVGPGPSPSPSGSPSASPSGSPSASPSGSPSSSPSGSPSSSPSGSPSSSPSASPTAPPPSCATVVTDPANPAYRPTCIGNLPLWNSRGYAKATSGLFNDVEAEALARCDSNGMLEVSTGAAPGDFLTSTFFSSTAGPNTRFPIGGSGAATYWETNWDPVTNTTTDGSNTVWVNGLHIKSSTGEDTIISHAEATADCPNEPTPTPTITVTATPTTSPSPPPPFIPAACRVQPGREPSGRVIVGTQDADVIVGTPRDDLICSRGGNDIVEGLEGADLIVLGRDDDTADAGCQKDTVQGGHGEDSISGGCGNDIITGGKGNDQIKGNKGIDTLRGGGDNDTLQGGGDDDVLRGGSGSDTLRGWTGNDILNGDKGNDSCIGYFGRDLYRSCEQNDRGKNDAPRSRTQVYRR